MSRVERYARSVVPTDYGPIDVVVYRVGSEEHLALICDSAGGDDETASEPFLCRVHSECWTGEVLHSHKCDCRKQLDSALKLIAECKHGVVVYLRQEGRGIGLGNKIRAYALQAEGLDTVEANRALGFGDDERSYEVAVAILEDLGIGKVNLLTNNPDKVKGLERGGIEVAERIPIVVPETEESAEYLEVKARRMGHAIPRKASR